MNHSTTQRGRRSAGAHIPSLVGSTPTSATNRHVEAAICNGWPVLKYGRDGLPKGARGIRMTRRWRGNWSADGVSEVFNCPQAASNAYHQAHAERQAKTAPAVPEPTEEQLLLPFGEAAA